MTLWQRALLAGYSAFFIFIILNFFYGSSGFVEKQKLMSYKALLVENLTELEELNSRLELEAFSLRADKGILQVESRELGYLGPNEGVILLTGWGDKRGSYAMGQKLKWTALLEDRKPLFRIVSAILGVIIFLLLTLIFPIREVSKKLQHI